MNCRGTDHKADSLDCVPVLSHDGTFFFRSEKNKMEQNNFAFHSNGKNAKCIKILQV